MGKDQTREAKIAQRILDERKRSDPLQWFIPTPTQEQFLRRDTVKDPFVLVGISIAVGNQQSQWPILP